MADTNGAVGAGSAGHSDRAVLSGDGPAERQGSAGTPEALADLRMTVDSMPIGVIVLDAEMRTQVVNRAFYDFWKIDPRRAAVGCGFRELMEASRDADPYGADEAAWQHHIAEREAEIAAGVAGSRQLPRNDGRTLMASLAPLAGGKRLISY